jgi:hypothetical protein
VTVYRIAGQAIPLDPTTLLLPIVPPDTPDPAVGQAVAVVIVDDEPLPAGLVDLDQLRGILDLPEHLASDAELQVVCDAATTLVLAQLDPLKAPHTWHPWDREAALTVAVDLWQARSAPGGQTAGPEWAQVTSPSMLGPGLIMRVVGVLGPCLASGGAIVA